MDNHLLSCMNSVQNDSKAAVSKRAYETDAERNSKGAISISIFLLAPLLFLSANFPMFCCLEEISSQQMCSALFDKMRWQQ